LAHCQLAFSGLEEEHPNIGVFTLRTLPKLLGIDEISIQYIWFFCGSCIDRSDSSGMFHLGFHLRKREDMQNSSSGVCFDITEAIEEHARNEQEIALLRKELVDARTALKRTAYEFELMRLSNRRCNVTHEALGTLKLDAMAGASQRQEID